MRGRWVEQAFIGLAAAALALPVLIVVALVGHLLIDAAPRLGWDFLFQPPARDPAVAGVFPSMVGSVFLIGLAAAVAVPVGLGAAIYLEEYARPSRLKRVIEVNIDNLASVPSLLYGLLGAELFIRVLDTGRSLLAGAMTLTLLLLPPLVISAREALRAVPMSLREAAMALGGTRMETVRRVVLPLAFPGLLTGVIVTLARGLGEVAALIAVGAVVFVTFAPTSLHSTFSALPLQIFHWMQRPQFQENAAGAMVVLLAAMLTSSALAIWLRLRLQRRYE